MQKVTDPALLAQLNGGGAPTPRQQTAPGVIVGRPKAPDPYKDSAEVRANQDQNLQVEKFNDDRSSTAFNQRDKLRSDYSALPAVKGYTTSIEALASALKRGNDGSGDTALIYDYVKSLDPTSVVREAEVGMAQGGDSYFNTLVAQAKKQFGMDAGGNLSPEARQRLRREIITSNVSRVKQYNLAREQYAELARRAGFDPYEIVGNHAADPYVSLFDKYDRTNKIGRYSDNGGGVAIPGALPSPEDDPKTSLLNPAPGRSATEQDNAALGPGEAFVFDEAGTPVGIRAADGTISGYSAIVDNVSEREAEAEMRRRLGEGNEISDIPAFDKGITLGLSDELYGVRGGLGELLTGGSFAEGYQRERDVERAAQKASEDRHGILPGIAGSVLAPAGVLGQAKNLGQFVRQGGTLGALAGYGTGEGLEGSTKGALIGGGTGALVGGAISQAPRLVTKLIENPTGQRVASRVAGRRAAGVDREVVEAGQRQGIPIRQPDARPETRNAFAAVEASPTQSDKVRRALDSDKDMVQSRLSEVGGTGTRLDNFTMGETVQGAGQRYIAKSRDQANNLYRRAEELTGDARFTPEQALKAIDDNIAELSANGPRANSGQIRYLEDLKADLSRGDLSIGQLRSIRTGMRGQISERNLTATDAERRVGQVIDAASADIQRGLATNPQAQAAYKAADDFYREKQTFIKDVVQRFTGTKNAPLSAEQAASKFQAMMRDKGDYKRFSEMLKRLEPDERADMGASIAEGLGTGRNGEFSLSALATNVSKMNPRALRDLFGEDGAKAIADLRVIARSKADTQSGLNLSKSGVVMAANNQFKDVLLGALGGGFGGVPGAMGGMAARGALERFSSARAAKLLLNPDFTRWLRQTPASTSPAVINRHFDRLNKIASREQAFLMDAKALQDFIASQFSKGTGRAAAEENSKDDGGK